MHYKEWPQDSRGRLINFLEIDHSENFTIKREGMVDGLGYGWWIREWKGRNKNGRPHLLNYQGV